VHVYLEGDGIPWATPTRIARDPSPHTPQALRLMALDPAPSLYLGRPCYHGLAAEPGCGPELWTSARYGESVTASMTAALERALGQVQGRTSGSDTGPRLTLIGYSGGGVLAMLMAPRLPGVCRVVTVAANLDIDAWTGLHGYTRLAGSLSPARQPPLPARIRELHLAGGRDPRVPARLTREAAGGRWAGRLMVYPEFDHACCWEGAWPSILRSMERDAPECGSTEAEPQHGQSQACLSSDPGCLSMGTPAKRPESPQAPSRGPCPSAQNSSLTPMLALYSE
jgi:pimeloyl-ACP methyl ester carboxylesterase